MHTNTNEYIALLVHANRAAELQREADHHRLVRSVPRRQPRGTPRRPWWRRLRRQEEIRRPRLA